jgi:hypothetical protein
MLGSLVGAARPFMSAQRSPNDFALLGLDVLVDADGKAWLLEINAPPSLAQCGLPLPEPDAVHADADADADEAAEPSAACKSQNCTQQQQLLPRRPDWGGALTIAMTRDLIAQFVLPCLCLLPEDLAEAGAAKAAAEVKEDEPKDKTAAAGCWVAVEAHAAPPDPAADAAAAAASAAAGAAEHHAEHTDENQINAAAWAAYKRMLAQQICAEQAKDDSEQEEQTMAANDSRQRQQEQEPKQPKRQRCHVQFVAAASSQ